jgi:hypothetical protein
MKLTNTTTATTNEKHIALRFQLTQSEHEGEILLLLYVEIRHHTLVDGDLPSQ